MCFKIFILCTGNVPATIGNLTNLTILFLHNNKLNGTCVLSDQFNKTKSRDNENADRAYLYQAKSSQSDLHAFLAGAVPATIGNLTNLTELNLQLNQLNGA